MHMTGSLKKKMTRWDYLKLPRNDGKLITESEQFNNVWYECYGGAVCINAAIEGRHIAIPGKLGDMKKLAHELLSIIELWSGI